MTVAVVGAGPAGVSAVMWLEKYGIDFLWFDATGDIGGMLHEVHNRIVDYPGLPCSNGDELVRNLRNSIHEGPLAYDIARISHDDGVFTLRSTDGHNFRADTVILCTGTRKRQLGIPGEAEGLGDCVRQSAARDAHLFAGKRVAVVGGGDSALEGCVRLAEAGAREVILVARSPIRARPEFRDRAEALDAIRFLPFGRVVQGIERTDEGCVVTLEDDSHLNVSAVFIRIGVEPVVPTCAPALELDEGGFIRVDERRRTSQAAIFAAGDVTRTPLRSIASSVADGAVAARSAAEYLEVL